MRSIARQSGSRYPENRAMQATSNGQILAELRALRDETINSRGEVAQLRRTLDEFAGAYLNARFPYGKPTDRWGRR